MVASDRRRTRRGLLLAAGMWTVFMMVALPGFGKARADPGPVVIPIEFRITTTIVTVAALVGLAFSVSGWRHVLVAPLWLILILVQCAAWWPR